MKSTIIIYLSVLALGLLVSSSPAENLPPNYPFPQQYEGWNSSITIDSQDNPHLSYFRYSIGGDLVYAYWTGSAWETQVVERGGIYLGQYNSIALDSQGKPSIAYLGGNRNLKYAHLGDSGWETEVVDQNYVVGLYTSISFTSADIPYISYFDEQNYYLKYALWELIFTCGFDGKHKSDTFCLSKDAPAGWFYLGITNSSGYNSLALDSHDNPHIAFFSGTDLKYTHWTPSDGWTVQTVDSSGTVGEYCSLALDSQDNMHIAYYDASHENLKYAHWNGSSWEIQIVDSAGYAGEYTSIAIDSQDNPHIAYYGSDGGAMLKYASWTGSEWEIQDVMGCWVNAGTSLALDSQDYANITCFINEEWIIYVHWTGSAWEIDYLDSSNPYIDVDLISFTATPEKGNSVKLAWQIECTGGEQIAGFNLYRREIKNNIAAEVGNLGCIWTKVNPSLITGQNPYSYTDSSVELGKSYEYKLEAVLVNESTEILGTASCAPAPPSFTITSLYPNPASDALNITLALPQIGDVNLELYDLSGRLVMSQNLSVSSVGEDSFRLDVSGLANGLYTLRATQSDQQAIKRLVIAR